jgi:hypothetical protein
MRRMALHFAYGSNMSRTLMRARCPDAVALGPARLEGWRYIVNGDGYGTVVRISGGRVHGVLWRLSVRDIAAVNAYENLHAGLFRARLLPVRHGGRIARAIVYLGRNTARGRPRPGYQNRIVVPAARDWNLPERYIAELARWVSGGAR